MILTTRTMLTKQNQRRRDSKVQDLDDDDDTNPSDPETYRDNYLDIPNEYPIQSFPSPSPALLEFCSDCDIELLLPSPVDTPRRRESGNEDDADFEELWRMRSETWEASDGIEAEEDGDAGDRLDQAVWRPEAYDQRNHLDDTMKTTTIYVQPPTPEQRPESPDDFESTSQCATPRAQSFVNLAALNTSPSQSTGPPSPVTSRYAPPRGGPKSPIAPQSPTTSAMTSWSADLVDRTKQKRLIMRDAIRSPPLSPTNPARDTNAQTSLNQLTPTITDGTIPPNPTPRNPIATPIQGPHEVAGRQVGNDLAQALRQEVAAQEELSEDVPGSPEPDEFISMAPKTDARVKKGGPVIKDAS
ncbi:hypothetical protein BDV96DRAFT_602144 [Lophiotrema nucula]|uniref:Uncharacterized protein n=1 Tax=Lophiotrema nucula TaxID=690887 RepID=A0A6A5Z103_9PLEO|nr:hypothetical protein BDV96DRAFT_602144 [Lophiotrema nucula]